jgi:hypothetical protein
MNKILGGAAALALLSAPLAAQSSAPNPLAKGATSVTVEAGFDGLAAGAWKMLSDRHNLGLRVAARSADEEHDDGVAGESEVKSVSVGLASRHYLGQRTGSLVPFVELGASVGRRERTILDGDPEETVDATIAGARGSVGVEWFLSRSVSLGASGSVLGEYVAEDEEGEATIEEPSSVVVAASLGLRIFL